MSQPFAIKAGLSKIIKSPLSKGKPAPTEPPISKGETAVPAPLSTKVDCCIVVVFINVGASFSIAITLYLAGEDTKLLLSCSFLSIKNVSSSILFLSDEGKLNQILPSSASYQRSIARL